MRRLIHRRALLTGAGAAAAAGPVSMAIAAATVEDPVLPLFREWVTARIDWYQYVDGDWDAPEALAAEKRETDAYWAIVDTTPATMAGIAALTCVLWDVVGPSWRVGSEEYLAALHSGENKMLRNLWRAASGDDGLPPAGRMEGALALDLIGRLHSHV